MKLPRRLWSLPASLDDHLHVSTGGLFKNGQDLWQQLARQNKHTKENLN